MSHSSYVTAPTSRSAGRTLRSFTGCLCWVLLACSGSEDPNSGAAGSGDSDVLPGGVGVPESLVDAQSVAAMQYGRLSQEFVVSSR